MKVMANQKWSVQSHPSSSKNVSSLIITLSWGLSSLSSIPPIGEPSGSWQVVFLISNESDILDKDIAVTQKNAKEVIK